MYLLQQPVDAAGVLELFGLAFALSLVVEWVLGLLRDLLDVVASRTSMQAAEPLADVARACDDIQEYRAHLAAREQDERWAAEWARLPELERELPRRPAAERSGLDAEIATIRELVPEPPPGATEVPEQYPLRTMLLLPASNPDDGSALRRFMTRLVAIALGIVIARVANLQLFDALCQAALGRTTTLPGWPGTDFLLTGFVIGNGSAPLSLLLRLIRDRGLQVADGSKPERVHTAATRPPGGATSADMQLCEPLAGGPAEPADAGAPGTVSLYVQPSGGDVPDDEAGAAVAFAVASPRVAVALDWLDIAYDGGVDLDRLACVNRRPDNPNLIVYHHTGMPRHSTFGDVVRVIHDRRDASGRPWRTAYHCVVTADGEAHPFCRWDRAGNHAQGFNGRSLGIALNGNFATDPAVPYSNVLGDYGPAHPSTAQLAMAARVVALWAILYDIPLEFERTIVPHRLLRPTSCPGDAFPDTEFKRLIVYYYRAWNSAPGRARIRSFAQKQYLFV